MPEIPVAVTAVGAVTALGVGPDCLFEGLLGGKRAIFPTRTFGVEGCRTKLAAEVTCEVPRVTGSRTADLAVLAIRDALSRLPASWDPTRVGLVLGSAGAGTAVLEGRLSGNATGPRFALDYTKGRVVDAVAAVFALQGPRVAINTACSSGAVAIGIAADWLRDGDCDWAIAVGSDELGRFTYSGFHALRAMDPEPCRPFDRARRGLSMGEGAGCLVLERIEDAARRHCPELGRVCAVGHACDAHHLTAPDPSGVGQARALHAAFEQAGITVDDIGFVNAHGTGTPLNDAAEVASLELGLGARASRCPVHSVKSTIGHCMGAAGAIEAVVALSSLQTGLVPHTVGLVDSEFEGRVNCVMGVPQAVRCDFAVSTSFGFGGNDAAVVLRRGEGCARP